MSHTIVTSTTVKTKSTQNGIALYTVSAQEFIGTQIDTENGRKIERIKLGSTVVLYKTKDIKLATTFVKRIKNSGTVVEIG